MTNSEYRARYKKLRAHLAAVALGKQRKIRSAYKAQGQRIADTVKKVAKGQVLTPGAAKAILASLDRQALFEAIKVGTVSGLSQGSAYIVETETRYVVDAVKAAGAEKAFPEDKIRAVFERQAGKIVARAENSGRLMRSTGKLILSNRAGFTLSSRIWKAVAWFEAQILAIVNGGLNQGRDGRDVAGDLMAYILGGPQAVLGRWGNLLPGTAEYVARLGSSGVDYRAMRLIRTEMYSGLQEEAVAAGRANPACDGTFDWILQVGRIDWACDCPSLASGGPYREGQVPDYPHPNCFCTVAPRLIDHGSFVQSLKDFVSGKDSSGSRDIELWAEKFLAA